MFKVHTIEDSTNAIAKVRRTKDGLENLYFEILKQEGESVTLNKNGLLNFLRSNKNDLGNALDSLNKTIEAEVTFKVK